jgi:hypothetical protein
MSEVPTIADHMSMARGKSEGEFVSTFAHPVLVEKVGVFLHEHPSLLAGTVLAGDRPNLEELEAESADRDLGDAKVFELKKKPGSMGPDIFVGRAPTNDIVLVSDSVSKSHAQLTPRPETGHYQVSDMFSSNGTFLNGEKIHPFEKHQMSDHDEIGFSSDYLFIYYSPMAFYELLMSLRL